TNLPFMVSDVSVEIKEISPSQDFVQSLKGLLNQVDETTVPTGILLTSPLTYASFIYYDGGAGCRQIGQGTFEQHYHDLQQGLVRGAPGAASFPTVNALLDSAKQQAAQQITPIVLANVRYNAPNRQFVDEMSRASGAGQPIKTPADPSTVLEE